MVFKKSMQDQSEVDAGTKWQFYTLRIGRSCEVRARHAIFQGSMTAIGCVVEYSTAVRASFSFASGPSRFHHDPVVEGAPGIDPTSS